MKNFIMKYLIYIAAIIFVILAWATFASAGTIQVTPLDPVVTAPQRPAALSWAGPYVGGMGGYHRDKQRVIDRENFGCDGAEWCDLNVPDQFIGAPELDTLPDRPNFGNCGNGVSSNPFNCVTRRNMIRQATQVWLKDNVPIITGSHTKTTKEFAVGAFAGYRSQYGRFVPGVEISVARTLKTDHTLLAGEAQAGLALGRVLPYISGGVASYGGNGGYVYGAGVDFALSRRVLIGVKAQRGNFGGGSSTQTLLARVVWRF